MFKLIFYGKQPQYPYINEVIITVCVKTAISSIEEINFLYSHKKKLAQFE